LAGLLALPFADGAQPASSPLEKYRKLAFPPTVENFGKGWEDRVALEFEIINTADLPTLRAGLPDENPFVRAMAARALGIRGDKTAAEALAALVKADPEFLVRIRAVESLGYLKAKPEVIESAKEDRDGGVRWVAKLAADQCRDETDHAAEVRRAYAAGIRREDMGTARVGRPAPDFTARTTDGQPFTLASVLGKKPVAIYFAAFDG
jgi:hypothetical protein